MIKNEQQYHVTKSWAERLETAIAGVHQNQEQKKNDPDGWQILLESYQIQLESLQDEIAEYETLNAHDHSQPVVLHINEINELSNVLIKARIAFKITQKEIAACSGITEQQIKNHEEKDYQNASFVDVLAVSDVLGIKIQQGAVVAELYDFYKEKLAALRECEHLTPQISASPPHKS